MTETHPRATRKTATAVGKDIRIKEVEENGEIRRGTTRIPDEKDVDQQVDEEEEETHRLASPKIHANVDEAITHQEGGEMETHHPVSPTDHAATGAGVRLRHAVEVDAVPAKGVDDVAATRATIPIATILETAGQDVIGSEATGGTMATI